MYDEWGCEGAHAIQPRGIGKSLVDFFRRAGDALRSGSNPIGNYIDTYAAVAMLMRQSQAFISCEAHASKVEPVVSTSSTIRK